MARFISAALLVCSFVLICCVVNSQAARATIFFDAPKATYIIKHDVIDKVNGVAWAVFEDNIETSGWGRLYVETNKHKPDAVQAYAAGYVEGALTHVRIAQHYSNMVQFTFRNSSMPQPVIDFLTAQDVWVSEQVAKASGTDSYWQHVQMLQIQYDGLVDGYNAFASEGKKIDRAHMAVVNAFGDMFDIVPHVMEDQRPNFHDMTHDEIMQYLFENNHCSAIIRAKPDLSDIFAGHSSWFTYAAMLRIVKSYQLHYSMGAQSIVQSSYPGTLGSNDDFYITSAKLVVMETTNSILNTSLYDLVTSHALLSWQRVQIANRMATSGPEWISVFSRHNSGTYNNQWMVLDYKLFKPNQPLRANTLMIAEQIPGYIESSDVTDRLYLGYWPSYNVPAQRTVWERSGYAPYEEKYGAQFTWGMCGRALIYREHASNILDQNTMQRFMRYNDWQHDPLSYDNPNNAVCARGDLQPDPKKRSAGGGYDSKMTSFALASEQTLFAIAGPTADQQPAFEWTDEFAHVPHVGQPKRWDFDWIKQSAVFPQ